VTDESVTLLSVPECWALLRQTAVGRISVNGVDDIEVFPVNFLVDGGSVVFRTAPGTKLAMIEDGTRGTFEADEVADDGGLVWCVVLKSPVRPISGHDAIVATFGMDVATWREDAAPIYVRMRPDLISGRRFSAAAV